ncbi:MAG: hypothetical protein ACRCYR_16450 [Phycicoccus sp.]
MSGSRVAVTLHHASTGDPRARRAAEDLHDYLSRILDARVTLAHGRTPGCLAGTGADPDTGTSSGTGTDPDATDLEIVVATQVDSLRHIVERAGPADLGTDEYVVVAEPTGRGERVWLVGADGAACRTAVFTLLRQFGCEFHLSGDRLPPPSQQLPRIDTVQRHTPRFALRGTQLWCYWYSGRDSWSFEDFRRYLDQFPKLGLNLLDIPLYFYEPLYTGYEVDGVRPEGYFLAGRDLGSVHIGREHLGAAPPAFTSPDIPRYGTQAARTEVAIHLMRRVFAHAREIGVRTCVGIEVANQLDFAREVLDTLPEADRYERGRLIQPGSPSAGRVLEARLDALFTAYPDCDYYALWQSEAGVWRTTEGSPHPADRELRRQLTARHPDLEPSDADYLAWLRRADEIVGRMKPDARLVTSGWGSEAVFACADAVLGDRFVRSSISPYEPRWAVDRGSLDAYDSTTGEKWHVTWGETDQHLWVMQPKVEATAALLDRLDAGSVSGALVLHWNTRYCEINLDLFASQCWSPRPDADTFRGHWARRRFGPGAGAAAARAFEALERLGDLALDADPTMQSWVGYECFVNPLLQAHRFVDARHPFPASWLASYVAPHLESEARIGPVLDSAVGHAREALAAVDDDHAAEVRRLLHHVEYVRDLHLDHVRLAKAVELWSRAAGSRGAADRALLERAAELVDSCTAETTVARFAAGIAGTTRTTADGGSALGELGLLVSLNEKHLGGVLRLRGRMQRALAGDAAPFRAEAATALIAVWPGMGQDEVSLAARDAPHAPTAELDAPVAQPWRPGLDAVDGSTPTSWSVTPSGGVRCQRLTAELGLWRHPDRIAVSVRGPAAAAVVQVALYLAEDTDWDSLFRRQAVVVGGQPLGEFDDFLGHGDDMGQGLWVGATTRLVHGATTVEVLRRGNSDVVLGGVAILPADGRRVAGHR